MNAGREACHAARGVGARGHVEPVHHFARSLTRRRARGEISGLIHAAGVSPRQATPQTIL
jgi:hypothetical protein